MVTITISGEAYKAIRATLPKGAKPYPLQKDERGGFRITLERKTIDRLVSLRRPGESLATRSFAWRRVISPEILARAPHRRAPAVAVHVPAPSAGYRSRRGYRGARTSTCWRAAGVLGRREP